MQKTILSLCSALMIFLFSHQVLSKNSSANRFKHYLAHGISHPSDLGVLDSSPAGLVLYEEFSLSAHHTTHGKDSKLTTDGIGFNYFGGRFGGTFGRVSSTVSNSSSSNTGSSDSTYYALGAKLGAFGLAISSVGDSSNTLGILYGTDASFRLGLTYSTFKNSDATNLGLGLAFDFGPFSLAVDANQNDTKSSDSTKTTNIGVGLGYFGDLFLLGVNSYTSKTSSDSAVLDGLTSDLSEAFVGFAAKYFVLRATYRPKSSSTADDEFLSIFLTGYF